MTLPESVAIDFVPASELRHYERFQWLANFFTPIAVGFWVSWATTDANNNPLLFSSIIFTAVSLVFILLAIRYRSKIFNSKVQRSMRLGDFK